MQSLLSGLSCPQGRQQTRLAVYQIMAKHRWLELSQEMGYDRNKFLILCYHIFTMTSVDPGDIAKQGLVCDICGELFDSVESLEQHRETEITNEEAGAGV